MKTSFLKDLESLKLGEPATYKNMTLFPLQGKSNISSDYHCFGEHLTNGNVAVEEIGEGEVSALRVTNNTGKPIFIPDGIILKGGFQTRTTDHSTMVDPYQSIEIATSCVEQGRWSVGMTSTDFDIAASMMFSKGRADKVSTLKESLSRGGEARASQDRVWSSVSDKFRNMDAYSSTDSLDEMNNAFRDRTEGFAKAYATEETDKGIIYACNDRIIGADIFDKSSTLACYFPNLIRGVAMDCIEHGSTGRRPVQSQAEDFFSQLLKSDIRSFDGSGSGETYELDSPRIDALLLVYEQHIIHCVAFSIASNVGTSHSRFSSRRKHN